MDKEEKKAGTPEGLVEHTEAFLETFLKLAFTTATRKAINMSAIVLNVFLIYVAILFIVLFAATGLAWWIGNLVNSRAGGFFIVAGFFLIITILIIMLRKKVLFPFIRNIIVRKVYE